MSFSRFYKYFSNEYKVVEAISTQSTDEISYEKDNNGNIISIGADNWSYKNKIIKNKIKDISLLKELKELREIELPNNEISDISSLKYLNELTILKLGSNKIKNISVLRFLKKLKCLDLQDNLISDINPLKGLDNLTELWLNNNQIKNISVLTSLKNLKKLHIQCNNIIDFSIFKSLNLNVLEFKDNLHKDQKIILDLEKRLKIGAFYETDIDGNIIYLDLSNESIDNLDFLKELINLTTLKMNNCSIEDISPLSYLTKLKVLQLSKNKIKDFSAIKNLNLDEYNLKSNKHPDHLIIEKLGHQSGNVPFYETNQTGEVITLSITNYNREKQLKDILLIKELKNIKNLDLSFNQIIDLSPLYELMKKQKGLQIDILDNPLRYPPFKIAQKGIPSIVEWFENNLNYTNQLIKDNIKYKNIKLDLGNCGITDLSLLPELFKCTHIEELILSNQYAIFNYENDIWEQVLSKKRIYPNNICFIPNELKKLKKLKRLILGGDWKSNVSWNRFRLKDIKVICNLSNLEYLNISNNEIFGILNFNKLRKLKSLHINNNFIEKIDPLDKFETLEELFLSNNNITNVDFLKNLLNIKSIDLHGNKIEDLSPIIDIINKIGIKDDKWLTKTICVNDNPLTNPSMSYIQRGKASVINILIENAKGLTFQNNDIKLIFIGNSEVGKSTLAQYLKNGKNTKEKIPYTVWLDEINTTINGKKIRILDFGGHDYYHDTHKIFFRSNVIYILLWETATNKLSVRKNSNQENIISLDYPLKYWLDSIDFYIKKKRTKNINIELPVFKNIDSYNSFVLLVQNKVESFRKKIFLDNNNLKNEYPFIFDFMDVDIHRDRNMKHFKDLLNDMILNMRVIREKYPYDYKIIKDSFETYSGSNILNIIEFKKYCENILEKEISIEQLDNIIVYLDSIGTILYHEDNNTVFINMSELGKMLIAIFSDLKDRNGEFDIKYVKEKVNDYSNDIIEIMKSYKLIFELPNSKKFIAPLYLPTEPEINVKLFSNNFKIIRRFIFSGFIQKNIILEIFFKYSEHINVDDSSENAFFWKDGLIIKDKQTNQVVKVIFDNGDDQGNAYIEISILPYEFESEFVETLINYIKKINEEYEFEEMVTLDGNDFVSLELLEKNKANKIYNFIERRVNNRNKETNLKQNNVLSLNDYHRFIKGGLNMKKIFISYSKFDEDYKEELEDHFITLKDEGLIETFNCKKIDLGENSHEVIQKELEECDYMIALVSIKYLNTEYIRKFEIRKAQDLGKKIIPIIIKPCDWENSIIKKFHASLRGTNISLDSDLFLFDKIKETSTIERHALWTKIIKELREKLFLGS